MTDHDRPRYPDDEPGWWREGFDKLQRAQPPLRLPHGVYRCLR